MIYDIPVYMTWSNRQPVTCELIGYFKDEIPDDEISIKRIDYWGHDSWDVMRGGRHTDTHEKVFRLGTEMNPIKLDTKPKEFEGCGFSDDNIGEYFRKFHKKLGDPNDDECSGKIGGDNHSDGTRHP